MATSSQAPLPFSGSGGPWEARPDWGAPALAVAATPLYLAQPASGLEQYGYTAPVAPAAGAAVFHTTETLALESPPSASPTPAYNGWGELTNAMIAPSSQQWGGPAALSQSMPPHYTQQLEQQNADLARQCHELQERLEAAAAVGSTSASAASTELEASHPPLPSGAHRRSSPRQPGHRSTLPQSSLGDEPDREEVEALKRRLAAKEREAEAAAAAAAAKHAQAAAREAELEQERGRAAELADEVARWKDECAQVRVAPEVHVVAAPCCRSATDLSPLDACAGVFTTNIDHPPFPLHGRSASARCARCSSAWRRPPRTPACWRIAAPRCAGRAWSWARRWPSAT